MNDDTYTIFYLIEEETRRHFTVTGAKKLCEGSKEILLNAIMKNEDLLFQWCLLASRIDERDGIYVLKRMVELYVTIRGFAFTSSCLEQ